MPIVILCQGGQSRLRGKIATRKQLLEVNGEPILARTIRLCREGIGNALTPIVVGWPDFPPEYKAVVNPNPGHCILEGIRWSLDYFGPSAIWVFLLGDVVFSRESVYRILGSAMYQEDRPQFFAVTKGDLGRGSGEVFAFVTHGNCLHETKAALDTVDCIGAHASCEKYQPGHLRELLWTLMRMRNLVPDKRPAEYHSSLVLEIDDWTTDIDTTEDVERLGELGDFARAEEER